MKLKDFKKIINALPERHDEDDIGVVTYKGTTVGGTPMAKIEKIYSGFDWNHGKIMINCEKELMEMSGEIPEILKSLQERCEIYRQNIGRTETDYMLQIFRQKSHIEELEYELDMIRQKKTIGEVAQVVNVNFVAPDVAETLFEKDCTNNKCIYNVSDTCKCRGIGTECKLRIL